MGACRPRQVSFFGRIHTGQFFLSRVRMSLSIRNYNSENCGIRLKGRILWWGPITAMLRQDFGVVLLLKVELRWEWITTLVTTSCGAFFIEAIIILHLIPIDPKPRKQDFTCLKKMEIRLLSQNVIMSKTSNFSKSEGE